MALRRHAAGQPAIPENPDPALPRMFHLANRACMTLMPFPAAPASASPPRTMPLTIPAPARWRLLALLPVSLPSLLPALLLCVMLALSLAPRGAWAQADDASTADQQLDGLRKQITLIQSALSSDDRLDDAALSKMKADALAANADAAKVATALGPLLASVQARLAQLGKPVAGSK